MNINKTKINSEHKEIQLPVTQISATSKWYYVPVISTFIGIKDFFILFKNHCFNKKQENPSPLENKKITPLSISSAALFPVIGNIAIMAIKYTDRRKAKDEAQTFELLKNTLEKDEDPFNPLPSLSPPKNNDQTASKLDKNKSGLQNSNKPSVQNSNKPGLQNSIENPKEMIAIIKNEDIEDQDVLDMLDTFSAKRKIKEESEQITPEEEKIYVDIDIAALTRFGDPENKLAALRKKRHKLSI